MTDSNGSTFKKTEFSFRLNGVFVPQINVWRHEYTGELCIAVRDEEIGWFTIDDRPDFILEYRDETSWQLLPLAMREASKDKGWNSTTPQKLIGILWVTGVLE